MDRALGIFIVVCATAIPVTGCGLPAGRISARGGPFDLDGSIASTGGGELIDTKGSASTDDLGLDDSELTFQPKAELDWGGLNLSLDGFSVGYSGTGIATVGLEIGNLPPIELGAAVKTDLDLSYLTLKATYDLIPTDVIDIGIGLGGGIVDYDLTVDQILGSGRFRTAETLPVVYPMIRVGSLIGPVRIAGYLGAIAVSWDGNRIRYIDGELYAGVRVFGSESRFQGWVSLGYRYLDFNYEYNSENSNIELDATIRGPYLSLEITF